MEKGVNNGTWSPELLEGSYAASLQSSSLSARRKPLIDEQQLPVSEGAASQDAKHSQNGKIGAGQTSLAGPEMCISTLSCPAFLDHSSTGAGIMTNYSVM